MEFYRLQQNELDCNSVVLEEEKMITFFEICLEKRGIVVKQPDSLNLIPTTRDPPNSVAVLFNVSMIRAPALEVKKLQVSDKPSMDSMPSHGRVEVADNSYA